MGEKTWFGTSSPVGDDNVYATPAATPPPALEEEEGPRTPPGALLPIDEPQLRISPKRKVENMDLDMDSGAELPALQKKARAASERSSVGEDEYQWDNIPPPRKTDQRLPGRFPWGNEVMVMGKPFSEFSSSENLSRGSHAERSGCATGSGDQSFGDTADEGTCAGEADSLYSAASDLTQVMTSASPSQSQPVMMGRGPNPVATLTPVTPILGPLHERTPPSPIVPAQEE